LRYELSPEAVQDIAEALIYLDTESPGAADKLQADFMDAFEHLTAWPDTGHSRSDLTSQPVRFWKAGRYLIVYRVAKRTGPCKSSLSCMHRATSRRFLRGDDSLALHY
jgi:plasmid stabilization system protein ParE